MHDYLFTIQNFLAEFQPQRLRLTYYCFLEHRLKLQKVATKLEFFDSKGNDLLQSIEKIQAYNHLRKHHQLTILEDIVKINIALKNLGKSKQTDIDL